MPSASLRCLPAAASQVGQSQSGSHDASLCPQQVALSELEGPGRSCQASVETEISLVPNHPNQPRLSTIAPATCASPAKLVMATTASSVCASSNLAPGITTATSCATAGSRSSRCSSGTSTSLSASTSTSTRTSNFSGCSLPRHQGSRDWERDSLLRVAETWRRTAESLESQLECARSQSKRRGDLVLEARFPEVPSPSWPPSGTENQETHERLRYPLSAEAQTPTQAPMLTPRTMGSPAAVRPPVAGALAASEFHAKKPRGHDCEGEGEGEGEGETVVSMSTSAQDSDTMSVATSSRSHSLAQAWRPPLLRGMSSTSFRPDDLTSCCSASTVLSVSGAPSCDPDLDGFDDEDGFTPLSSLSTSCNNSCAGDLEDWRRGSRISEDIRVVHRRAVRSELRRRAASVQAAAGAIQERLAQSRASRSPSVISSNQDQDLLFEGSEPSLATRSTVSSPQLCEEVLALQRVKAMLELNAWKSGGHHCQSSLPLPPTSSKLGGNDLMRERLLIYLERTSDEDNVFIDRRKWARENGVNHSSKSSSSVQAAPQPERLFTHHEEFGVQEADSEANAAEMSSKVVSPVDRSELAMASAVEEFEAPEAARLRHPLRLSTRARQVGALCLCLVGPFLGYSHMSYSSCSSEAQGHRCTLPVDDSTVFSGSFLSDSHKRP